jgi:hypothetical protein
VFLLALGLTSGALAVLHDVVARPSRLLEALVLVVASTAATLSRYVCLRWWVFAEKPTDAPAADERFSDSPEPSVRPSAETA